MISFRFHVVSLTAVFLAIAIGVVVGTTYVDRAVVENLESRIDRVSENLDERRAQIAELEGDLEDLQGYAGSSAEFAVTDRLPDVPVLLLALRGIDAEPAEELATLLRRAGARTAGVVWLEPAWALEDDETRVRLADIVADGAGRSPDALVRDGLGGLVDALRVPTPPDVAAAGGARLEALVEAGFLAVDDLGDSSVALTDLAGSGARVVVLTGTEAEERLVELVPDVVQAVADGGLAAVAADVFVARNDGPDRGEVLWSSLPEELRERVVVVDAAERPEGRVATVLGVGEATAGRVGRYGYGPGADGVLPAWSEP